MYLSRVEINPYRRNTVKVLSSPQVMHAAVMASFPSFADDPGRVMWRVDKVGSATYIIIQSETKPDLNHIVDQYGRPEANREWDCIEYGSFISELENGQMWRFRIKANPTYSIPSKNGGRGKVVAHMTADQQMKWMLSKAPKCGFDIPENAVTIRHRDVKIFKRGGEKITLATATFEGVLMITDTKTFRKAMIEGIGRGKAYGCGLLTLARM